MARRFYSNPNSMRLPADSRNSPSRLSPSSTRSSSSSFVSSSLRSALESTTTSLAGGPLLGVQNLKEVTRHGRGSSESLDSTDAKVSPKPQIRRYGRTTHSSGFGSEDSASSSSSSSSSAQQSSGSGHHHHLRINLPGRHHHHHNDDDKLDEKDEDALTASTTSRERRRARLGENDSNESNMKRIRPRSKNLTDSNAVDNDNDNVADDTEGQRNASGRLRRSRPIRSIEKIADKDNKSDDKIDEEAGGGHRRRRRQQSYEEKSDVTIAGSTSGKLTGSDQAGLSSREDSGIVDCDVVVKASDGDDTKENSDTVADRKEKTGAVPQKEKLADVKIKIHTCDVLEDQEDSGVHLDEPTSPATDRWSGHVTSPVKTQWTDEDLDAFVRQLSNPQHHVAKIRSPDQEQSPSARKCSLDLCHELKDRDRVRAPLARSETDTSVSFGDYESSALERGGASRSGEDVSKGGGLISGLSGLRLIKNKKLARSSHANAKRYAAQKSKDETPHSSASLLYPDGEGVSGATASSRDVTANTVTFSCNSSPEGSDGEVAGERRNSEQASNGAEKEVGKKRRFRKMLTRPLNRSQSAGCAKDVPAHALFLEQQEQKKSKEAESLASRKPRASEGDIRHVRHDDDNDEVDDDNGSSGSKRNHVGRIHKTKSADSAMMAAEEFGAVSQPKSKSRNIAKKITKKMQFLRRRHTDSTLGMMGKDDGARRLATIDPEEAQEWSKSFETLLFDKTGLELFRGFLMSEHSDENIEFWIACENYKTVKSNKQLQAQAQKIYNDYVAVQSKREVNLDSKTRNTTYESVLSNPNRQTFDEAQRRVQALMEKDSYRRFLESELYQDLAAGNIQHKS